MKSFRKFVLQLLIITITFLRHKGTVNGFGINLIKVPDDDISQVVCSMALLHKYYNSGESLSGSVLYMSLTTASMHTQKRLLEAIHTMTDYPWSVVIRDSKSAKSIGDTNLVLHEKPQCYFVIIENLEDEDLEDIFEDWKITINWNPLAQFVVYLSSVEETDEEMTELMVEILLSFMNKKIYNVNVFGQNEENGFYYGKTVFPYHPDNNCGNRVISIETLDVCDYHVGERDKTNDDEDASNFGENDRDDGDENYNADGVEGDGNGDRDGDDGKEDNDGDNTEGKDEDENDNETAIEYRSNENNNDEDNEVNEKEEHENEDKNEGKNYDDGFDEVSTKDTLTERDNDDKSQADDDRGNKISEDDENILQISNTSDENGEEDLNIDDEKENANPDKTDYNRKYSKEMNDSKDGNGIDIGTMEVSVEVEIETSNEDNKQEDIRNEDASIYDENNEENNSMTNKNERIKKVGIQIRNKISNKSQKIKTHANKNHRNNRFRTILKNKTRNFNSPKHRSSVINANGISSEQRIRKNAINHNTYNEPKFLHLETYLNEDDEDNNTSTQTNNEPHLYFEEVFRALFLDKFPKDLSGCPLAAAYRPWEPYIFTESSYAARDYPDENTTGTSFTDNNNNNADEPSYDDGDGNTNYQNFAFEGLNEYDTQISSSKEDNLGKTLSGIEYQLLLTIGERLHMNIDLQIENTNLYHLFQELIDGDIEMVIGGIDEDPSMSQYVSTTIPYHQDDLTWCVAKARRSHSLFNFLASFSLIVWLTSFFYIIVASLTILWMQHVLKVRIKHLKGFSNILFRVFGNIFNQSMPIVVRQRPLRLAFASTFFMGLLFINAYQSFLISTLTTPKSAYQINKIEEIYQNRMTIKGSVDNVRHLNKEGEIFKYIREKFQMCYNIEECLMEAAENENVAVAVSRQHSFYNPRIPRSRLYCFDRNENIYVYLVTMLLPKKFHLLHKINPVIQHVIESGHMQKWARDLDMRRRILEKRNHAHDDEFRSLTLGQVVGPFVFSGALLLIAIMTLVLENCVHRLATKRRRRRLKIVKFLHRQFLRA